MNALLRKQKDILRNYNYSSNIKYPISNFRTYVEITCIGDKKLIKTKNENLHKNQFTRSSNPAAIYYDYDFFTTSRRNFSLSASLYETQPSKVEATIQTLKNKQKEKEEDAQATEQDKSTQSEQTSKSRDKLSTESKPSDAVSNKTAVSSKAAVPVHTTETSPVPVKKSLGARIWDEVLHYYHGFRLLFIDINVCRKLLFRLLMGKSLTRREHRLLIRTTSDLFRLVPFSVFIIVPFMELLLPFFIKYFPGMLPSTFQTSKDQEAKLKQSLQIKLEVAKFLQKTLDEMSLQHSDRKSEEAKAFAEFFRKIKDPNEHVSSEEIIKFSKRFEDEVTLDALSKDQLTALCRILDINTIGTSYILRFNLLMKLRKLAADDKIIAREGVDTLNLFELQQACRARGMRAYGVSEYGMRRQLQEWIELSLNEKVPSTLLLLSRAIMTSSVESDTADKLKDTIRTLPESLAEQTKANIGELEGKVDNKTKIEIVKEELKKINEERAEQVKEKEQEQKEKLVDSAPMLDTSSATTNEEELKAPLQQAESAKEDALSSKDVQLLSEALTKVSDKKKTFVVEKETINKIKEEIQDYKDDLAEFEVAKTEANEDIKESRGAKLLYQKVDNLVGTLNKIVEDLEKSKEPMVKKELAPDPEAEERVKIRDLVGAIKQLKSDHDENKLKTIENVLMKIDADRDGEIKVDDILKIVESLGKENVKLNQHQIEELVELLEKEKSLEAEEKIQKALAKSMKEEQKQQQKDDEDQAKNLQDKAEKIVDKTAKSVDKAEILIDTAPKLQDKAEKIGDKSENIQDKSAILLDTATEVKEADIASTKEILNVNETSEEFKEQELKRSSATGAGSTITSRSSASIPPTTPAEKPKDKLL